ncbi:hypothetical protein AHF37_11458 [Paragonimus kellicotti]|nr:hypothetical protein AHF37_11458 [Paragonimus kellicotti]
MNHGRHVLRFWSQFVPFSLILYPVLIMGSKNSKIVQLVSLDPYGLDAFDGERAYLDQFLADSYAYYFFPGWDILVRVQCALSIDFCSTMSLFFEMLSADASIFSADSLPALHWSAFVGPRTEICR